MFYKSLHLGSNPVKFSSTDEDVPTWSTLHPTMGAVRGLLKAREDYSLILGLQCSCISAGKLDSFAPLDPLLHLLRASFIWFLGSFPALLSIRTASSGFWLAYRDSKYSISKKHLAYTLGGTCTWTVGLSTMEMFWMFIFVSSSFAMTWSMCTMSQENRRRLHSGRSFRRRWHSCTFSASRLFPQASSKRSISSLVSKFSGSSRRYCFNKLATVLGSYSSRFGDSSRS